MNDTGTPDRRLTVCICTYNSGRTLRACLNSVKTSAPGCGIIVVDHNSSDETVSIAGEFGCKVYRENVGLGYARNLCMKLSTTDYLAFVDSDVEIVAKGFFNLSAKILQDKTVGAVVGSAVGHRFLYGLPASLLVLRKPEYSGIRIPAYIDARETYYIQGFLKQKKLKTVYVRDAIIHRSEYRKYKPEWEGANTRLLKTSAPRELVYAFLVVCMLSLNSKNIRNLAYTPVFYLKFLRGFTSPNEWRRLRRNSY